MEGRKKILGIFAFMPSSYMCQTVMTGTPILYCRYLVYESKNTREMGFHI